MGLLQADALSPLGCWDQVWFHAWRRSGLASTGGSGEPRSLSQERRAKLVNIERVSLGPTMSFPV